MPQQEVNSAILMCSFGAAPGSLIAPPASGVMCGNQPAAAIMDNIPMTNITTFGMCSSLANPAVASATSAALGVLTPQPCVPVTPAPWTPGSPTVLIGYIPALNSTSTLVCQWGGVISISTSGQMSTLIP
jgi:hypothetical protein